MAGLALLISMLACHGPTPSRAQSLPTGALRDCADCPLMVPIPPGTFLMGVPREEEERESVLEKDRGHSEPQHRVTLRDAFGLGRTEVTRAQFAAFVRDTGYAAGDKCDVYVLDQSANKWKWKEQAGRGWRNPGFTQTDDDPVVCVSWDDAEAYVGWLSRKSGRSYRLPSEAEWEYAARAGSVTSRFWGDGRERACRYANVADRSAASALSWEMNPAQDFYCSDGYTFTAPVGRFAANVFGLYDMLGNVWEWVEDCRHDNYRGAPTNGAAWIGGDCGGRVVRGGSWSVKPGAIRVGYRARDDTSDRSASVGFRVAGTFEVLGPAVTTLLGVQGAKPADASRGLLSDVRR